MSFTHQRPDQRRIGVIPGPPGSRSGSGELSSVLQGTGIPPLVPGLETAQALQRGVNSAWPIFTFPAAGHIWGVDLSDSIVTNGSYSLATSKTFSAVQTVLSGLTLAVVELSVADAEDHDSGSAPPLSFGVAVQQGESVILNVNGGTVISNLDERASAILYYSVP